jgi:PBSX family phage terminase large subunit
MIENEVSYIDHGLTYKFEPLFDLLENNNYPEVDTVIITGGRYSLKSYSVSIFALTAMVDYNWNVLYTRFTNMSIVDSIKPELSDKIEMLGFQDSCIVTDSHIKSNNNQISFKGIKTGSKQQTANLKSLSGFNCFVNDEAEELPDYKTFKKIFYSIRSKRRRNLNILILNPTSREHWIFKEFFEKKGLTGGDNCIKDNVMYIHASYLDCDFKEMPNNILADYKRLKIENPDEYDNIVLGGWIIEVDGLVLPRSSLKRYKEFPTNMEYFTVSAVDAADTGTDHFAMPICRVYGNRVYVLDAIFSNTGNLTTYYPETLGKIKEHKINNMYIETNSFGMWFKNHLLNEQIPGLTVFGAPAKGNKMGRILANAGIIKYYFYFPENPNPTLQKFIDQCCKLMKTSTKEDDALDSLASVCAYLEKFYNTFKE